LILSELGLGINISETILLFFKLIDNRFNVMQSHRMVIYLKVDRFNKKREKI